MPEMPEVESIARQLRNTIVGKRIVEVTLSGLSLRKPIADGFSAKVLERRIFKIHRRGKYLIIELEPKAFLLIHLGMSGRILFQTQVQEALKHTHAIFRFSDGAMLEYRDPRRFGLLAAYEAPSLARIPELEGLGKDPLEAGFTGKWLEPWLRRSRKDIKAFLLDQRIIAGLGNIYVCEALFLARIHPLRRCDTLTGAEISRLANSIRKILRAAIRNNGTSFSDFMGIDGKRGANQRFLKVFQREGDACFQCGTPIQRICQANRSSFYCSKCQC